MIVKSDGVIQHKSEKIMSKILTTDGYYSVKLSVNNQSKSVRVHRLVANAFIPNPNNLAEVNHIDFDRTNNKVENLEWITHYDNIQHTLNSNRHFCQTNISGKNNPNYGNHKLGVIYKNNPQLAIEKLARPKEQNGRAVAINLLNSEKEHVKTFKWIGGCAEFLKTNNLTDTRIDSIRNNITIAIKAHKKYLNYYYELA